MRSWAAILVALLAIGPAAAATIDGTIHGDGAAFLDGQSEGSASLLAWGWSSPAGSPRIVLSVVGSFQVHSFDYLDTFVNPPIGDDQHAIMPLPERNGTNFDFAGQLEIGAVTSSSTVLIISQRGQDVQVLASGPTQYSLSPVVAHFDLDEASPFSPYWDNKSIMPEGPTARADIPVAAPSGTDAFIVVYGAPVRAGATGDTIATGAKRTSTPMAGYGSQDLVERRVFVGHLASFAVPADVRATSWLAGVSIHHEGTVQIEDVQAAASIDDVYINDDASLFEARGNLWLNASWDEEGADWHVSGTAVSVRLDGHPTGGLGEEGVIAIAATAVVAVVAWKVILAAFVTRATGKTHPARQKALTEIDARPGLTIPELSSALGIGRAATRFHLEVMRREHLVDVVRAGRAQRVFPNSGAFSFAATPDLSAAAVLAFLREPLRLQILETLMDQARTASAIRSSLPGTPPSRALVAYHLKRMEERGLITRKGAHGPYRATINLSDLKRRGEPAS
jgi:predicted transcriptional regulator